MSEYLKRRRKLISEMPKDSLAIIFGSSTLVRNGDVEFPFRQNSDFLYLTGFEEPNAVAILESNKSGEFTIFCQDKEFISWLLNLRCYKKKYTPSVPAIAIITHKCCYIYLDKELTSSKHVDFGISPIKICDINLFGETPIEQLSFSFALIKFLICCAR